MLALGTVLGVLATPMWAVEDTIVADRIVAVVGERLVLTSDIALEASLAKVDPSPVVVLRGSDDSLQDAIDRAIIRGLAGSTAVYAPSDAEVRARADRIRSRFKDDVTWRLFQSQHGIDDDRLAGILYSRLVVERYVLRNVEQSARGVDPETYYREWIGHHRARVAIRMVPTIDPGAKP